MLWVLSALACLPSDDAPDNERIEGSDDDTVTDVDGDGYDARVDCDDLQADVHPGAAEKCGNERDDNCNGTADGCDWSGPIALDGTKLTITIAMSQIGTTLAVCDANGDGIDDVVTSALGYNLFRGAVYVFYGPIDDDRDAKDADYALLGDEDMYTGASVDCRRDIDGDLIADIIVGEPGGGPTGGDPGTVYVVPGGGTGEQRLADAASSSWIGSDLGERLGYQLVAIDADGDQTDELAVTPAHDNVGASQFGIAYVFDDVGPGARDVDAAVAYVYGEQGDRIDGFAIGNAGDLDGDGVEELAIDGNDPVVEELVVFGAPLVGPIAKSDADIRIVGGPANHVLFSGIGHADLDADGRDDLFVGSPNENGFGGALYAFLTPIAHDTNTAAAELRILGPAYQTWGTGTDATSLGDVDGDDIPDLLVSAAYSETVYLQYGGDPGVYELDETAQAWWQGTSGSGTGITVAAGDVTGDRIVELLIGSPDSGIGSEGSITIVPAFEI
jgi:hypothetical protein